AERLPDKEGVAFGFRLDPHAYVGRDRLAFEQFRDELVALRGRQRGQRHRGIVADVLTPGGMPLQQFRAREAEDEERRVDAPRAAQTRSTAANSFSEAAAGESLSEI